MRITSTISLLCAILISILFSISCRQENPAETASFSSYEWETSTSEQQGVDGNLLLQAFNEAEARSFIDSILLIRNGNLFAESYYNGYDRYTAHNVRSVSKSILSTLIGIALQENYLQSLDQRVLDFFSEYHSPYLDPRKYNITIEHLLTMKAGFGSDTFTYNYIYNSSNWVQSTVYLPLVYSPGAQFSYSTFGTHLLSVILSKATGMSTLEFANRYLFAPLQIFLHEWEKDPQGYYFGGNNMFFTPRDMARFGALYLHNGVLNDRQIVSGAWVQESLQNYTGYTGGEWGNLQEVRYGYLWWLGRLNEYEIIFALGIGGQYIIVIPELEMIIVTTAVTGSDIVWEEAYEQERSILDFIANYILPAVKS